LDWDKLRVFHAVTLAGNFTKASEILNISQSAIGRQISILERDLGAPLFKRVARGVVLTEAGQTLQNTVLRVAAKLDGVQGTLMDLKTQPWGPLHIVTTLSFGSLWVAPRLQEFLDQYPDVQVTLTLREEEGAFPLQDADIAITSFPLMTSDLLQAPPLATRFRIYASRAYLQQYGTPETFEDLDHHRLIGFGESLPPRENVFNWLLKGQRRVPYLVANSGQALFGAVKAGIGIAALHRYFVQDDPDIVEILPHHPPVALMRHVVYPAHLSGQQRIEAFVTFITNKMKEEKW